MVICLQVGARCLCVTICLQVVTRVYNVLQVHVSPRSEVTFGNDVEHRNCTAKNRSKVSLYTTNYYVYVLCSLFTSPQGGLAFFLVWKLGIYL